MGKKLNASAVNSAAKKVNTMKRFHLTDNQGEIWDIDVNQKMNPEKVIDMVTNVVKMTARIVEEGIEDFDYEKHWAMLYFIELLKAYTSIEIPEKETAGETLLDYLTLFNSLNSLGLIEAIAECFDESARRETIEMFRNQLIDMSNIIYEEAEKLKQEVEVTKEAE